MRSCGQLISYVNMLSFSDFYYGHVLVRVRVIPRSSIEPFT